MALTEVTYGGVTMRGVITLGVEQSVEYDPSGTDLMYHKFVLRFLGQMHTLDDVSRHGFDDQGDTLADNYRELTKRMMQPRKLFEMTVGGARFLRADKHKPGAQGFTDIDVNNGPKPLSFNVRRVVADQSLEVEFSIELALIHCENINNSSGVLSNRWGITDEIDENLYTHRTIEGELITTSPLLHNAGPHALREWVLPVLQRGFKRERMRFAVDKTGKRLTYSIQDRQVSNAPPAPATSWSASHRVTSSNSLSGIGTQAVFEVRMVGPESPGVKRRMIDNALAIARFRLKYENSESGAQLEEIEVGDVIEESRQEIFVKLRVIRPDAPPLSAVAAADLKNVGDDVTIPGYDRFKTLSPKAFGTASLAGIFVAHLQSACEENHRIANASQGTSGQPGNRPSTGGSGSIVAETYEGDIGNYDTQANPYDQAHLQAPYIHYQIEAKYIDEQGKIVVPYADASPSSQNTVAVIKAHRPMTKWILNVVAERIGLPPILPPAADFVDGGITYSYLRGTFIPRAPTLSADGRKFKHTVMLSYEYQLSRPIRPGEGFRNGSLPWDKTTVASNKFSTDNFQTGIA